MPSKKNQKDIITNKTTGKSYLVGSRQYARWKREHDHVFRGFHEDLLAQGIRLPIVRCKMKALFYFPDTKSRDLTNKFETIADMLVEHGILADDDFKVLKPITLDGWVCKNKPRTEIYITIIDPLSAGYTWDITSADHEEKSKKRRANQAKVRRLLKSGALS